VDGFTSSRYSINRNHICNRNGNFHTLTTKTADSVPKSAHVAVLSSSSSAFSSASATATDATTSGSAAASPLFSRTSNSYAYQPQISKLSALLSKIGMIAFIISMCLALPLALIPQHLVYRMGWINQVQQQTLALRSGQFCARWLLRLIPFCRVQARTVDYRNSNKEEQQQQQQQTQNHGADPEPSIWVCNHTSALDVFILMAMDKKLRGKRKRPIKIVYVGVLLVLWRNHDLCVFVFLFVLGVHLSLSFPLMTHENCIFFSLSIYLT
jgi:hypothetical protein